MRWCLELHCTIVCYSTLNLHCNTYFAMYCTLVYLSILHAYYCIPQYAAGILQHVHYSILLYPLQDSATEHLPPKSRDGEEQRSSTYPGNRISAFSNQSDSSGLITSPTGRANFNNLLNLLNYVVRMISSGPLWLAYLWNNK